MQFTYLGKVQQYNDDIIIAYDKQGNKIAQNRAAMEDTVKLLQEELRRLKKNQSLSPNRKSINIKIQRDPTATKYPNRSNSMAYRSDLSNSNMNYSSNLIQAVQNMSMWKLRSSHLSLNS